MAVTNEASTQLTNVEAAPPVMLDPIDALAKLRFFRFNFTQGAAAGDATSTMRLCKIPGGKWRVALALSRIAHSAFGAARTGDLGWEAYTGSDGVAVAADPNGLDDGQDISGAGSYSPVGTVGGDETYEFDSQDGVVIALQCNDGTIPAAATINGYIVAVQG